MSNSFNIDTYHTLEQLYSVANFDRTPFYTDFDIFTISETYPSIKKMLLPHRRNFFTILFFENQADGQLQVNDTKHSGLHNVLLFQSPQHIFSYVRGSNMKGYIILFNDTFLLPNITDTLNSFNFFNSLNNNLFHLNDKENNSFVQLVHNLIGEMANKNVAKHLLLAFLQKCTLLQEQYLNEEKFIPKSFQIVRQFQQQINNHFLENKSVEFYAQHLNITANHLNETIKNQTGKTAKQHIFERTLLEAKNLLLYSEMDIAEIGYYLGFSEPSHFGKFFKNGTNQTPKQFRANP
jgi:AraC family transcriptional regulator, transcriptional activator of pobA